MAWEIGGKKGPVSEKGRHWLFLMLCFSGVFLNFPWPLGAAGWALFGMSHPKYGITVLMITVTQKWVFGGFCFGRLVWLEVVV